MAKLAALLVAILAMGPLYGESASLDMMIVGKEVLEIADTWQLTQSAHGDVVSCSISPDGKQVAFVGEIKDKWCLCLVPSTGGSVKTIMRSDDELGSYAGKAETAWHLCGYRPVWTSDGNYILLAARAETVHDQGKAEQDCLIVLTSKGDFVTLIPAADRACITSEPMLSPDGQRAVTFSQTPNTEPGEHNEQGIVVFDLAKRSSRAVPCDTAFCFSYRFSPDSRSWGYYTTDRSAKPGSQIVRRELNMETGENQIVQRVAGRRIPAVSPDGSLLAWGENSTISVENAKTGTAAVVVKTRAEADVLWAPNSHWFLYTESRTVSDHAGARERDETLFWLASTETHKFNTMPLVTGGDAFLLPTWSDDSLRIAYASKGRVYAIALKKRAPTPEEKLEAGLPLTEQDERHLIEANADTLRSAIRSYQDNNQGLLPPEDYEDALYEVLSTYYDDYPPANSPFCRPGTTENIFAYFRRSFEKMQPGQESKTIIGELDAGYNWKVVIYADGHSATIMR